MNVVTLKPGRGVRRRARRLARQHGAGLCVVVEMRSGFSSYDAYVTYEGLNATIWDFSQGRGANLRPCPLADVQWQGERHRSPSRTRRRRERGLL
jgi:hypothetical protein